MCVPDVGVFWGIVHSVGRAFYSWYIIWYFMMVWSFLCVFVSVLDFSKDFSDVFDATKGREKCGVVYHFSDVLHFLFHYIYYVSLSLFLYTLILSFPPLSFSHSVYLFRNSECRSIGRAHGI